MKLFSNLSKRLKKNIINNRSGQGATEYILLLVVIVGLVVMFGPKLRTAIEKKTDTLSESIQGVSGGG